MRARSRSAIRGCAGVRRLAPATAVGLGGRRGCRCGIAGRGGSRPHWAAPRRFLADGRSAGSRRGSTSGGARVPVVALTARPVRVGSLPAADPPRPAPTRWTGPGPFPSQRIGTDPGVGHWAAPGRHWCRHFQFPARGARSRAASTKVGAGRVVLMSACPAAARRWPAVCGPPEATACGPVPQLPGRSGPRTLRGGSPGCTPYAGSKRLTRPGCARNAAAACGRVAESAARDILDGMPAGRRAGRCGV
jgi:hypothetical protein